MNPVEYETANAEAIPNWDSMAQLTLLTVIGEEFEIEVDFEAFEGATSFSLLAERLAELAAEGKSQQ